MDYSVFSAPAEALLLALYPTRKSARTPEPWSSIFMNVDSMNPCFI